MLGDPVGGEGCSGLDTLTTLVVTGAEAGAALLTLIRPDANPLMAVMTELCEAPVPADSTGLVHRIGPAGPEGPSMLLAGVRDSGLEGAAPPSPMPVGPPCEPHMRTFAGAAVAAAEVAGLVVVVAAAAANTVCIKPRGWCSGEIQHIMSVLRRSCLAHETLDDCAGSYIISIVC